MGTKIHAEATRVFGAGFDLSCALSNVDARFVRDLASEPVFCDAVAGKAVGKPTVTLPMQGYMFVGTDGADIMLHDAYLAAGVKPLTVHSQSAAGSLGLGFSGRLTELPYGFKASGAGSITSGATWQGESPFRGPVLATETIITGPGALATAQWIETIASGKPVGIIVHLSAHAGTPTSIVLKVEEGTDGVGWADVAGLTAIALAGAAPQVAHVRITAAAALGPYFRLSCTTFTGYTSATLSAVIGEEAA